LFYILKNHGNIYCLLEEKGYKRLAKQGPS